MRQRVSVLVEKGFLASPEILEEEFDDQTILLTAENIFPKDKPMLITKEVFDLLKREKKVEINWVEFEKARAEVEMDRDERVYNAFLEMLNYQTDEKQKKRITKILDEVKQEEKKIVIDKPQETKSNVIILQSHNYEPGKKSTEDFVKHFKARYEGLKKFLVNRQELKNLTSISRVLQKGGSKEEVSIIGLVYDKRITKNGNVLLTLEDSTGMISVLVSANKGEAYKSAKDICGDEVIGVNGVNGDKIVFANNLFFPEVASDREIKKSPDEVYAAFLSCIHVGSKLFLEKAFINFINWLNGKTENKEQKEVADKIRYLFLVGDNVDGVGVYPEQDKELEIKDVKKQYEKLAEYLSKIKKDVKIIICPGNHDALRISEPQPVLNHYADPLRELENLTFVSNPALVNIHSSEIFSGFDVLMYHGFSFTYYGNAVDSIRGSGKSVSDRTNLIMEFLLKRRHLAPSHSSTRFVPETDEDPLVIKKVPDIWVAGHIHKSNIGSYKNVLLISCSCWQAKTSFQEKMGHDPDPGKVPFLNLKTREIKTFVFSDNGVK